MAVQVHSAALVGVDAVEVEVEVDLLRRLPRIAVVGLPASEVRESTERLRSAVTAAGFEFPRKRVIINLAPAGLRKDGCALDLPMALGILAADEQVSAEVLENTLALGELSLGGALRPVRGAIAAALLARERGQSLLLPSSVAAHAAMVPDVRVLAADSLRQAIDLLTGAQAPRVLEPRVEPEVERQLDLADVRGQDLARRALEIAAAGGHHVLMVGPPGCGKSMLAQRLPTLLPPLTVEEALEVHRVHSAAGLLRPEQGLRRQRPFRAPHHSVSAAGLAGGASLRPGEISLAHHGVLFLDEAPEFQRAALEVLRAPLEDGRMLLSRAGGQVSYPARVTLVMAANPCPCGYRGSSTPCDCTDHEVLRYRRKLSGPLRDRVDLHLSLTPLSPRDLLQAPPGESSAQVRARVVSAQRFRSQRGQTEPNARLHPEALERYAALSDPARELLCDAVDQYRLSGRATNRVRKVARTVADLAGCELVERSHLLQALAFRPDPGPLD